MAQQSDNPASSLTDIPKKIHDYFNPPPKSAAPKKDNYATPIEDSAAYKADKAKSNATATASRQSKTAKKYPGAN